MSKGFYPGKPVLNIAPVQQGGVEVFAYIRVSSHEQEDKYGPLAQKTAILKYCEVCKLSFIDDSQHTITEVETGSKDYIRKNEYVELDEETKARIAEDERKRRITFTALFARAKENGRRGIITHIVAMKMDRFSRTLPGLMLQMGRAIDSGTLLHSCDAGEDKFLNLGDEPDPSDKFVRYMLMAMVEYDRDVVVKRFRGGKREKKSRGGFIGGLPPFGYKRDKKDILPDEAKTPMIRRTLELIRTGHNNRAIAAMIQTEFSVKCTRLRVRLIAKNAALYQTGEYHGKQRSELVIAPL